MYTLPASDCRAWARAALRGNWGLSVGVYVVYAIVVGAIGGIVNLLLGLITSGPSLFELMRAAAGGYFSYAFSGAAVLLSFVGAIISVVLAPSVTGFMAVGFKTFFLDLVSRRRQPAFETLFSQYRQFGKLFTLYFFITLYTFLWSLLFIIPGIIAGYRYAMAPYLMIQNPNLKPLEAIRMSGEMMRGRKGDLFFLQLSFIGWYILAAFTWGIGLLWLVPYVETSFAVFYLDITGQLRPAAPPPPQQGYGQAPPPQQGWQQSPPPPQGNPQDPPPPPPQQTWQVPGAPPPPPQDPWQKP